MSESVYREPGELPPEPKRPSWWQEKWDDYVDGWKRRPELTLGGHVICAILGCSILVLFWLAAGLQREARRDWRSPCAEYVSVPEQTHTVDGTPVTVTRQKCLRLKEGR